MHSAHLNSNSQLSQWCARDVGMGKLIEGNGLVVKRGRLENDGSTANEACHDENPEEKPVEHHGHELPILYHFNVLIRILGVLSNKLDASQGAANVGRQKIVIAVSERSEICGKVVFFSTIRLRYS